MFAFFFLKTSNLPGFYNFTNRKIERIKNIIYKIVMECLEICLPL